MFEAMVGDHFGTNGYKFVSAFRPRWEKLSPRYEKDRKVTRPVLDLIVREARRRDRISIASAGDFRTKPNCDSDSRSESVLPFCLDFVRSRALYAVGTDREAVQAAPFYYLHLRRNARRLLSVPIEHGRLTRMPVAGDPVFLFSPGRCGSTLLTRVLNEAQIPSVSEPDFFTQMSSQFWCSPSNPWRCPFQNAMWNLSADLSAVLGSVPVIKLRAECSKAPDLFVRSQSARTIVLFRGFEAWARSTARVFGAGPHKAVRKYMSALRCYARLRRISRCHLMHYEDWLAAPTQAAGDLGRFLGSPVPPEAVSRARQRHSQEGTPLAGRARPSWEAKFDAALRLWRTPRLVTARQRLEIPNVWD